MKVGFIGLGMMGKGMANNLQQAQHSLIVYDVNRDAAAPFIEAGAKWANSPRAVAEAADVVFTSLPGPPEVEAVALGPNGIIEGMKADSAYFDLSTNSPTLGREIHEKFASGGFQMLDAPVSGGPAGAASGKLAIWVGGDKATFDKFKTVLDNFSDNASYIGPSGAGSIAKLVHNATGYILQAALAEVFTMGVKAGVEPLAIWEAVRTGASGRRRTYDGLAHQYLPNKYSPPAFALKLAHKDMTLATALGREVGVPMRLANLALAEMTEARNRGWDDLDSRSPMQLQNERAGVEISVDMEAMKAVMKKDPPN